MTLTFDLDKNEQQGRHFHILVHVPTKFDQNPISGLGAMFGDGQTDGHVTKPRSPSQSVSSFELGTHTHTKSKPQETTSGQDI